MIYEGEEYSREKLTELRKSHTCAECGNECKVEMDYKDTVMHLDDIDNGRMPDSYGSQRKALEKQAEITWSVAEKVGYDKRDSEFVYNPDYLDYQKGVKSGKVVGRIKGMKEVVEWIEQHGLKEYGTLPYGTVTLNTNRWQAFLKEKGLDAER